MIESYTEVRVVMAPSGELILSLPVYANQLGALLDAEALKSMTGVGGVSIGVYEHMGYIMYHPAQQFSFYLKSLDLFEDLGDL